MVMPLRKDLEGSVSYGFKIPVDTKEKMRKFSYENNVSTSQACRVVIGMLANGELPQVLKRINEMKQKGVQL